MKCITLIALLCAMLVIGCTQPVQAPQEDVAESTKPAQIAEPEEVVEEQVQTQNDVRLTAKGFDVEEVTVNLGESVTIFVNDDMVEDHYLSMDGARISEQPLTKGGRISVSFTEEGAHEITDDTGKFALTVYVN